MRKLAMLSAAAVMALAAPAMAQDELMEQAQAVFQAIPTTPPAMEGNAYSDAKADLGKKLFFDPRLSASGLLSCNTCHNVGMGGDDNLETSVGHGWQKGPRNAPTVFNAVFNVAQFWDGRAEDLEAQAKGPVQASVEMNNTPAAVEETLRSIPDYVAMFQGSFPGESDPVTFDNMARAIEVFETTLITPNAPFDRYLGGDAAALDDSQKQGLALFMDKSCVACHAGQNVGGEGYFPFGLVEKPGADVLPANDTGRFAITQTADDQYVFRAPPLRNVALTAPYFHSGKVWNLTQAVGVMAQAQLGETLTDEEVGAIVAFLESLTGDQPQIVYPILPASTDATPLPRPM